MRSLLQLTLAGLLLAGSARSAVYYVATTGDDGWDGSARSPFRTIARGVQAAAPGDSVIVRDGTYRHENAVSTGEDESAGQASPVVLKNSGTADGWIILKSENKWGAILDCEMTCDSYIDLANASYWVIQDFVITHGFHEAIHSNDAAHHITLRGNRIENIANRVTYTNLGLSGMYTNPQCHDFVIDGNLFHDIGRSNPSQLDHGLYLRGTNFTITNNIFYNISRGWSIQIADGVNNLRIENNTFAFANEGVRGGQIMLWSSQTNVTIRGNIFYAPVNYGIARYRSNLSNCTIDHNLVFGALGVIADGSGCSQDSNVVGPDPLFVNVSLANPLDFHLQPGSPAIGIGGFADVFSDFDGLARQANTITDAGAYVFVAPRQQ